MKKNYLLMAAAAMLLASCSNEADSPKNDDNNNVDAITLTALSPQSQASRIKTINGTRDGEKKGRLELINKVAPVLVAANYTWSATGVAIANNNVYITWHSDGQAGEGLTSIGSPAKSWGGAIDVLTSGANGGYSFGNTVTSYEAKFNNVVADGSNLYISLTSGKNGAAVGRVNVPPVYTGGQELMDTIVVPGSSVNAVAIESGIAGNAYVVSGYKGGVFSFSKNFKKGEEINTLIPYNDNFGGKFITGGYVLRTDPDNCYIVPQNGGEPIVTGAPLVSELKYAEKFDPESGDWTVETGTRATYYGKHTMAVDGNYIYVAGGQAEKGSEDGLRVYDKTTGQQVWGNATNTTAVCVEGNFVYAATGAGLRVYKKYDAANDTLELFAFETVDSTDEDGKPIKVAGTDAHSCNNIAVVGNRIYMANGQSGLYIFELDTTE